MATTTNYGWTTPDDTDLVKNGADAIRTLGSAIDTSMNTALGTNKAGMVLLNTTSFSAVSSVSLPANTFTSTYDNYRILFNINSSSTTMTYSLRFRTSGSDNTTANYNYVNRFSSSATGADVIAQGRSQTSALLVNTGTAFFPVFSFDLLNPKDANFTRGYFQATTEIGNSYTGFCAFGLTTSFDSATLFVSTGNITGNVSVYGYNK
jgi:hypothetical protein